LPQTQPHGHREHRLITSNHCKTIRGFSEPAQLGLNPQAVSRFPNMCHNVTFSPPFSCTHDHRHFASSRVHSPRCSCAILWISYDPTSCPSHDHSFPIIRGKYESDRPEFM
jgi:hypothetical protein